MSDVTDTTSQSDEQMLKDMAQSEHDSTASELREDISTDSDRSSRNRSRRSAAVTPSKSTELTTSTPKSKSPNAPVSRTTRTASTGAKVAGEATGKHSTVVSPTGSAKNLKAPCRPGIPWIAGARLEAKDYLDKWYPARVHDIDFDDCTVLIHFEGWNQRYDEWVPMDSDDLRPVARHSERSKEKPKRVHRDEHRPGDYVFAKWTDCRMYPARVTRVNHNGSYEVLFYDGFRKTVQEMNIRAMPADIQQEYAKAGLLPDGTKRGKCPDGVGLSKNVPPTLKDVTAMLKAVAVKREEDVLDKKRKRMSIGESVTAKKARLAVDDTDTFVGQKSSTKQPKQVKMSTSSDRQSTSSSHGDSMDEDDMKLTEIAKGETAGSSASSISDRGDVEATKEPLYAADSLQLDGTGKKKRQPVARKEFKVEADHNEFKCVESSCGKSFRKKSLLDYHIKYYHMTPDTVSVTTTHTPSPAAPRKRKKTTSMCSTDSEISVGGHMGGSVNRKKRDSAASLSSLPPDTPTSHMAPIAASNSPPTAEVTKKEPLVETRTVEETHPGVSEESIPEEQPEEHGVAAVTSSPLKVKDEVVNCICRVSEETGLMVQCDVCLCWQHAACMELSEDTLPRRYVCFVCSNAPGLRDSARYLHDQDWLRVGAMAHFDFLPPDPSAANKAQIVSTTHDLVGDAHLVQKVLDSLRRNIHVLKDKKQPELGFWTENWDEKLAARKTDTESGVDSKVAVRRTLDMHAATDQPTQSDSCSDLQKSESDSKVTVKSESSNETEVSIKLEDDATLLLHKTLHFEGEGTKVRKNATTETRMDGTMENSENSSSEVKLCHKTGDSCTKDETPVVEPSRVAVTVSGSDGGAVGEVTVKSEVSETEEESKVICERNLLDHIITSHSAIDRSLNMIEEQVTVLEMGDEMGREGDDILRDASHIKRSLHQLIADLATVRRIAAFH